jgi:hypothetical protein
MSSTVVDATRSVGIALYGILFGLACYTVWRAFRERQSNHDRHHIRKMWTAVVWLGTGIAIVAGYGASRRFSLLVDESPVSWREFWATLQIVLLIIGLQLALKVEAQTRRDDENHTVD